MEFQDAQKFVLHSINEINHTFQKVPGSAMLIRYIQSSYQDDPVRSAIELILVIFFVRYLLAPSYATHNGNFVTLSEEVGTSIGSVTRSGDADVKTNRRLMTSLMNGPLSPLWPRGPPLRSLRMRSYRSL
jgi:hypothetical protein